MFDIGFWELSLIMLLALLIVGPERLPRMVSTVGNWAGRAKFMARSLRMQMERELAHEVTDLDKPTEDDEAKPPKSAVQQAAEAAQAAEEEAMKAARAKQAEPEAQSEAAPDTESQSDDRPRAD